MNPSEESPEQEENKANEISPNKSNDSKESHGNNSMQLNPQPLVEKHPLYKRLSFSLLEEDKLISESNSITLQVENFTMKDGFSKHQIYSIKGEDSLGPFEAFRTYSDFLTIRSLLQKNWPGCYVPPLPKNKMVGGNRGVEGEDKAKYLEEFCRGLTKLKFLFFSKEFQTFLKGTKNNTELEKILKGLGEQSVEELIEKYAKIFNGLNGVEINQELKDKIQNFRENIKILLVDLERIRKISKKIAITEKEHNSHLNELFCEILPLYEKKCLGEYLKESKTIKKNFVFGAEKSEILDKFKQLTKENSKSNMLEIFHELIRKELKELDAFLEIIDIRDKWEKKKIELMHKNKDYQTELQMLSSGKNTVSSILSFTKKENSMNNLKNNINESIKNIENLQLAVDIINAIIGHIEITKFKTEKVDKYYKLLAIYSTNTSMIHKQFYECWENLIQFMNQL